MKKECSWGKNSNFYWPMLTYISGLVQERCNSIANTLEFHLSYTYPWIWNYIYVPTPLLPTFSHPVILARCQQPWHIVSGLLWVLRSIRGGWWVGWKCTTCVWVDFLMMTYHEGLSKASISPSAIKSYCLPIIGTTIQKIGIPQRKYLYKMQTMCIILGMGCIYHSCLAN